jgi:hypothetical protein
MAPIPSGVKRGREGEPTSSLLKNGLRVEPRPSGSGFCHFSPPKSPLPHGRGSIFNAMLSSGIQTRMYQEKIFISDSPELESHPIGQKACGTQPIGTEPFWYPRNGTAAIRDLAALHSRSPRLPRR